MFRYLYLSLRIPQRDVVGADGRPRSWSLFLPQNFGSCADRVPQKGALLVHQVLRSLWGPLWLHRGPLLAASRHLHHDPTLLLHEEVDVTLRCRLLLLPAFVLHHQLADGFVRGDGVQLVAGMFPPFLPPSRCSAVRSCSPRTFHRARVPPLAAGPKVMRQTAGAAVQTDLNIFRVLDLS